MEDHPFLSQLYQSDAWDGISESLSPFLLPSPTLYALGFFAGPPCETFSVARGNELEGISVRTIRDGANPWGYGSLTLRELRQIVIGNTLLLFILQATAIQAIVGHFACVEHPGDPMGPKHRNAASIWRLSLMAILQRHPAATFITVQQGRYGAPSPKPTGLLFVGPKRPNDIMKKFAGRCTSGTCIGYDVQKKAFRTAQLKEYPPKLCQALSAVFETWLRESPTVSSVGETATEASTQLALFRQELNTTATALGPDFNPAACAL